MNKKQEFGEAFRRTGLGGLKHKYCDVWQQWFSPLDKAHGAWAYLKVCPALWNAVHGENRAVPGG